MSAAAGVVLTCFMEGTSNVLTDHTTQIGLFAEMTDAFDLRQQKTRPSSAGRFKIAFDGCGVTNGCLGLVCGTGLRAQCAEVISHLKQLISERGSVTLNAVGLSRGAVGACYLAQMLASVDPSTLRVNLLLFDPVPGNFVWAARYCDPFGCTNARASMDLTQCQNVQSVLALYPEEALPDLAVHAPSLPEWPANCDDVEEDVVLGCHQGALFAGRHGAGWRSCLSFTRIKAWLVARGTTFFQDERSSGGGFAEMDSVTPQQCHDLMSTKLKSM